jgi:hypothetical protein
MTVRLVITDTAYALQQMQDGEWSDVAVLPGGASALLPAAGPLDEAHLEAAIQHAEDWLMPNARRLQGQVLEIEDMTRRLESGLDEVLSEQNRQWSVADFEALFLRIVDLVTGRRPAAAIADRSRFVADVLLVREIAHHGAVVQVVLKAHL